MADEFNLSPTNNTEKFLDDILRTAQGEQAQFNLVPNWRIEAYLDAIKNALESGGGGVVPTPTSSDNGKVLTVASGEAAWKYLRPAFGGYIDLGEVTLDGNYHGTFSGNFGEQPPDRPLVVALDFDDSGYVMHLTATEYFRDYENNRINVECAAHSISYSYIKTLSISFDQNGAYTGEVTVAYL